MALKQYKITFHGEGPDVFLAYNGNNRLYKRGMEAPIDENFLGVLKHTLIETHVKGDDEKMRAIQIPRFAYSVEPA